MEGPQTRTWSPLACELTLPLTLLYSQRVTLKLSRPGDRACEAACQEEFDMQMAGMIVSSGNALCLMG